MPSHRGAQHLFSPVRRAGCCPRVAGLSWSVCQVQNLHAVSMGESELQFEKKYCFAFFIKDPRRRNWEAVSNSS